VSEVICVDSTKRREARGAWNRRTGVCASARHTATDATGAVERGGIRIDSDRRYATAPLLRTAEQRAS